MPGGKGGKTKHDRCVEGVKENSPNVDNPHAVCVSAGVEPSSWGKGKKMRKADGKYDFSSPKHNVFDTKLTEVKKDEDDKKEKKAKLVKALADAGFVESALLLKNWGEMDETAELMKSQLEKQNMAPAMPQEAAPGAVDTPAGGPNTAKAEECHEDDPHHEAKEKKIAQKQKELAQKQLDMHKADVIDMKTRKKISGDKPQFNSKDYEVEHTHTDKNGVHHYDIHHADDAVIGHASHHGLGDVRGNIKNTHAAAHNHIINAINADAKKRNNPDGSLKVK